MIDRPDGNQLVVCVLGLSHKSGNETTNPHFNLENSPKAQFQALQQMVGAKENNASMRQVIYYHDIIAIVTILSLLIAIAIVVLSALVHMSQLAQLVTCNYCHRMHLLSCPCPPHSVIPSPSLSKYIQQWDHTWLRPTEEEGKDSHRDLGWKSCLTHAHPTMFHVHSPNKGVSVVSHECT